ncbi:unnamed protein product [Microthlaspi erraticum]|uniref:BZIP domain-containing protein n=1 Tax=Microthlaspi erraticum TaxID=1685480 RepID=A0A6D2I341_9BRAS|nr:unnamed protein product [Microthlaspi erraticum]
MTQVTMEDVWKEINLASLHQHRKLNTHEPMLRNQNPHNSLFQDFLNIPLNQQPPHCSSSTLHGSPLPLPPATFLSLNPHSINTHFEEPARFGCFGKKRDQQSDESRGERRHKRMIKNRESAARSRARKQDCASPYSSSLFTNSC